MSSPDDSYYAQLDIHCLMLSDRVRCEAYRSALARQVKKGDVVLDVGAGMGILSLLAVQAGARKVYAVERASVASFSRKLVKVNGAEERVQIIHGDMESVTLPEPVDVIVSEWMGGCGVDEGFLPAVLLARDRWLKPRGRMLPERVTAWIAPVWDSRIEEELSFWRSHPYEVDLGLIAELAANEVRYCQHHITGDTLSAAPQEMWTTDVHTCSIEEARSPYKASLSFSISRACRINALAAWFQAEFGQGDTLTNAPDAPKTHWGRFVFPLDRAVPVGLGSQVKVDFVCEPTLDSHCRTKWSIKPEDGDWEQHQSIT